jgi:hypothetical protein
MQITIEIDDAAYAALRESVEGQTVAGPYMVGAAAEAVVPVYPGGVEEFLNRRLRNLIQIELQAHPPADLKLLEDQARHLRKLYTDTIRCKV